MIEAAVVVFALIAFVGLARGMLAHSETPPELDEHYVPVARSAKPDNDVTPYPVDADTQPASRKRSDRRAA